MGNEKELMERAKQLEQHVRPYPDFPKPGILFRDFFPIFTNQEATKLMINLFVEYVQTNIGAIDAIYGLDARGFLIGPLMSQQLNVPFYPIRKKGKLPGKMASFTYKLEYGEDTVEIQLGNLPSGSKVIVVDDLLATGGTLSAANQLLEKQAGYNVVANLLVLELCDLKGRDRLETQNRKVFSLLHY